MSLNNDKENEIQVESEFNNLNTSDNDSNSVIINHENCYDPEKGEKSWCKECVPHVIVTEIIEGWTSGNNDIDNFIKDTIYYAKIIYDKYDDYYPLFLEWVPFDKFTDIEQIGEGGFAKVYSATWIDGNAKYEKCDGSWEKSGPGTMKVALKRLNGSQNISAEYLNELKIHWDLYNSMLENDIDDEAALKFYGITKDPETREFMIIMQFADKGNLRFILSSNFNNILWKDKIDLLRDLTVNLMTLHELGYSHKDYHCGNILQSYNNDYDWYHISDFGLSSKPSNEPKSDDKVYGVLPYIAPEVLNGEKYTFSSDIYSFGIIMTELSSGKPPFYKRKHDASLALDIVCNGLRPEFGKGTPEIYKKLAYRCMNANPDQRPTVNELFSIFIFWYFSIYGDYQEDEKFGYKRKEIQAMFKEADKEIPNISTSYEKDPDAIYTSRAFTFSNLSKPINSSIMISYLNDDNKVDLEVTTSSSQATKEEQEDYHSLEFDFELSNSNKRIIMIDAEDEREDLTVNSKKIKLDS